MGIHVEWDTNEKAAIRFTYERPWTWDDLDAAEGDMLALLGSVGYRVDLIFDIRRGGFPPGGAVARFRRVMERRHERVGQLIFIAPPLLAQIVKGTRRVLETTSFARGSDHPDFRFVTTLEQARALVHPSQGANTDRR